MVMGTSKNLRVFNFAIKLKSRKFDAREIYMFYSSLSTEMNWKPREPMPLRQQLLIAAAATAADDDDDYYYY